MDPIAVRDTVTEAESLKELMTKHGRDADAIAAKVREVWSVYQEFLASCFQTRMMKIPGRAEKISALPGILSERWLSD